MPVELFDGSGDIGGMLYCWEESPLTYLNVITNLRMRVPAFHISIRCSILIPHNSERIFT